MIFFDLLLVLWLERMSLCFPPQVHLQTQQKVSRGLLGMGVQVLKSHGVLAFYNGLTASLGRQVSGLMTLLLPQRLLCGRVMHENTISC